MLKSHSEFVSSLLDLLAPLGGVTAKRMFGGYGFYKDGLMFGLVAYDKFFLKVDEQTKTEFETLGLEPFTHTRPNGTTVSMSYHVPPEDAFNSPSRMKPWAARAFEAALRAFKGPRGRKRPKGPRVTKCLPATKKNR